MAYQYETNSPKLSRGYAEPENKYKEDYGYEPKTTSFADSLESQYYFDRSASTRDSVSTETKSQVGETSYRAPRAVYSEEPIYAQKSAKTQESRQPAYKDAYYDRINEERERSLNARYKAVGERENPYAKEQMVYTTDDSAPSATTMQFVSNEVANPFEDYHKKGEAVDKKYTINTKGKILIAVYALVVVTVFALIILNTRLLKSMNATSYAKEQQIAQLSEEVNELKSELNYVSSDEVIEEKAAEKGMIKA